MEAATVAITDLVTRLTLNARNFTSGLDTAINDATRSAQRGGRAVGEAFSGAANAGLNDLANRIPLVGGALAGLGPLALGAAAGIGAIGVVLAAGVGEAEKYAQEVGKLDAVLRATGNTTAFTSEQLLALADDLQNVNAIDAEQFIAAQRQLATFGGVAGSVFRDVLELSADLSATFGGDVVSNTEKLGMAMQGLAEGNVQPLSRAFKFLGTEALGTIAALSDQGKAFEAQQALIDALRSRIGGAGAAAGDDLTSDLYRLADVFAATAQTIAESSGAYENVRNAIKRNTSALSEYIAELERLKSGDYTGVAAATARLIFNNGAFLPDLIPAAPAQVTPLARLPMGLVGGGAEQLQERIDARTATEAAAAEAAKARAAVEAAKALDNQRKAQEAATRAAQAQAKALAGSLDDLKFQARIAGETRENAQQMTALRNLERQFGPLITAEVRLQALAYLSMAESARELVETLKQIPEDFAGNIDTLRDKSLEGLQATVKDFVKDIVPSADDPETRRRFEFTSNAFFEILSRGQGSFWATFEQAGNRAAANVAARLVNEIDLGGLGDAAGQLFGPGFAGYQIGSAIGGKNTGSAVGGGVGAIGGFIVGGPLGAFIGSAIGSTIGGLIGSRDPFADAFLTTQNGQVTTSRIAARGDGREDQANQLAGSVSQGLAQIAGALGGSVANGLNLGTIGSNRDTFFFNPTGGDFRSGGAQRFATPEQAVQAALQNAIAQGAVAGIDASVARLLSAGDLQTQTAKAAALANALRSFDQAADPFGTQVRALTDEFTALRDIMLEAGSSTADLNRASADYDRRLNDIRQSAGQATTTLRSFLDSLGFGVSSPLALGRQREAAQAAFDAQRSRIGSASFDQTAFTQAGQRLLDIEGQLFGRTDSFFTTFEQVQADTRRAIEAIDRAAAINGENPFARATAAATEATAENTAGMLDQLANLPAMIAQSLAQLGIGGGGGGDDGRGFVTRFVN